MCSKPTKIIFGCYFAIINFAEILGFNTSISKRQISKKSICGSNDMDISGCLLEVHNAHRKNAGLKMYKEDQFLVNIAMAAKSGMIKNGCRNKSSPAGQIIYNWNAQSTFNGSFDWIVYNTFNYNYNSATKQYQYPGETFSVGACHKINTSNTSTGANSLDKSVKIIDILLNEKRRKFGCVVTNCGTKRFVLVCQYELLKSQKRLFSNQNFENLCNNEPGKWRSCNNSLDMQCKNSLNPQTTKTHVASLTSPPYNPPKPPANKNPGAEDEKLAYTKVIDLLSDIDKNNPTKTSTKPSSEADKEAPTSTKKKFCESFVITPTLLAYKMILKLIVSQTD